MELVATSYRDLASCLIRPVNEVHHVTTISSVAEDFAVDESWLAEVASEMDTEDACIWVHGIGDNEPHAFTNFGIETLRELVRMRADCPHWLKYPE